VQVHAHRADDLVDLLALVLVGLGRGVRCAAPGVLRQAAVLILREVFLLIT
jgi:hypothetical protein